MRRLSCNTNKRAAGPQNVLRLKFNQVKEMYYK